ncbi:MAG: hypothetical protein EXR21_01675 [Flavobacteriaceae bacterium]|nr:hypothetical protein [Flavobacteriaceae bacterium]
MNDKSTKLFTFLAIVLVSAGCVRERCKRSSHFTMHVAKYISWDELRKPVTSGPAHSMTRTGKIFSYGNYLFMSEMNRGIHIINNQNPASPAAVAFVKIPGVRDLAVVGNVLYANSCTDLVILDIADPQNVKEVNRFRDVFTIETRGTGLWPDASLGALADWDTRDTIIESDCMNNNNWARNSMITLNTAQSGGKSSPTGSPAGKAGSESRFGMWGNYLYCIDQSYMAVFDISNTIQPTKHNNVTDMWGVESIFPYNNYLFIGSNSGLLIYDMSNPKAPAKKGQLLHFTSCDPLAVEGDFAYVTLSTGRGCGGTINQLEVVNIKDPINPFLVKDYPMFNPKGVGLENGNLFLCDGKEGLKCMDAKDPADVKLLTTVSDVDAYDVIPLGNLLIMVAAEGLYQYDVSNPGSPKLLSKLSLLNE